MKNTSTHIITATLDDDGTIKLKLQTLKETNLTFEQQSQQFVHHCNENDGAVIMFESDTPIRCLSRSKMEEFNELFIPDEERV